jgi:hypothetical protein
MNIIKKNRDALTYSSKENIPPVPQEHKSFGNVAKFKCFGTTIFFFFFFFFFFFYSSNRRLCH